MRKLLIGFFGGLLTISNAFAQVGDNPDEITLFGLACEKITNGESKSSARMRAADKASFKSLENITELANYRQKLDGHNFNLKVYQLVDNYLEDVKITVTDQNDENVCVEVSSYLPASAIKEVFAEDNDENAADKNEKMTLELEVESLEENVSIAIPPKPDIVINEQIAYAEPDETPEEEVVVEEYSLPHSDEIIEEKVNSQSLPEPLVVPKNSKTVVFIDKTDFYNNTSTNGFFAHLEQQVLQKPDIKVIASLDNPDYIIKPKVLKARIDNVNSETGRLQIVVSIDLTDTTSSKTITEHQNRFVLFNASDDTQAAASELTKKLFAEAIAKILPRIKIKQTTEESKQIITPH